jgi:hypothetical protein
MSRVCPPKALWGLAALAVALSACTPAPAASTPPAGASAAQAIATPAQRDPSAPAATAPAPQATATPGLLDSRAVAAAIEQTLRRRAEAAARGDEVAYMATIDQQNLTWKRVQNEIFQKSRGAVVAGRVLRVQQHHGGYVKAWIDVGGGEKYAWTMVFRLVDGQWLLSEPRDRELGSRKLTESKHFRIRYWEWDADVVERAGRLADGAYEQVVGALKVEPKGKPTIVMSPTFETHPGRGGHTQAAFYNPDLKDTLFVRSLESYGTPPHPSLGMTAEDELRWSIAHELTHLVNDQVVPIVKMQEWMSEGLAEWVSSPIKERLVRQAVAAGPLPTLDRLDRTIHGKEQMGFSPQEVRRAYDLSIAVVEYIVTRYSLDGFWKLASAFATTRSMAEATPQALGISYEQLEREWQQYARQQYGR